ncbi:hypothetical protein HYQ46_003314 [Verticillium longisporum]|nr:hypothetical protein HYQ46_003314 [Verticillium longisporum]
MPRSRENVGFLERNPHERSQGDGSNHEADEWRPHPVESRGQRSQKQYDEHDLSIDPTDIDSHDGETGLAEHLERKEFRARHRVLLRVS